MTPGGRTAFLSVGPGDSLPSSGQLAGHVQEAAQDACAKTHGNTWKRLARVGGRPLETAGL